MLKSINKLPQNQATANGEGIKAPLTFVRQDGTNLICTNGRVESTHLAKNYKKADRTITLSQLVEGIEINPIVNISKSENFSDWVWMYEANNTTPTIYGKIVSARLDAFLKDHELLKHFWLDTMPAAASATLSSGFINSALSNLSAAALSRQARISTGGVDLRSLSMNGISGSSIDLKSPLFVRLKGAVDSGKSTEAMTGLVSYRLGNTIIGGLQAYANSGTGFGHEGRQLEPSAVVAHSFGPLFVEGQLGLVVADNIHFSDWKGMRTQITLGFDAAYVSPFIQLTHRQLDRNGKYNLNDTAAYVGLEMDIAGLKADTYSIDTRLLTKVGYGSKNWSKDATNLGATAGFSGSVEWSASLNLNSGISFSTNLSLDTSSGSTASLSIGLDR